MLMLDFQLKQFLLEGIEQECGTVRNRRFGDGKVDTSMSAVANCGAAVSERPTTKIAPAASTSREAAENIPAIFFQRIGCVDRRAQAAAGTRSRPGGCTALRVSERPHCHLQHRPVLRYRKR